MCQQTRWRRRAELTVSSVPKVDVSGWTDVLLLLCCQEMTRLKGLSAQLHNEMEVSQVMMMSLFRVLCVL